MFICFLVGFVKGYVMVKCNIIVNFGGFINDYVYVMVNKYLFVYCCIWVDFYVC